jgi:myo-inositol 2-dehydrogenase / D-chiro-inositol 1-dehydrogenase
MRIGVIGCGVIAYWYHLRELRTLRRTKIVAIAERDATARERARQLTGAAALEDADELLRRDDIDAVIVSAPTYLNAGLAISAARAGKHVYIEKPATITRREALDLQEAVRQADVRATIGFNRRYHPLCKHARTLIAAGAIGSVRSVLSTFCEPLPAETMPAWKRRRSTGGGVLLDLASHHVDLLRWFLNDEVAEARASIASHVTEDDQAWLELRTCKGVESRSFFSFRTGRADWLEFAGESGTLRVDRHRRTLSMRVSRRFGYGVRSAFLFPPMDLLRWWGARLMRPSYEPSYRLALSAFVESIQGEKTEIASLEDGLRSVEVLFAAEESARLGESNPVPFRQS